MADVFSQIKRSEIMKAIRSEDTIPEMKIRKALHGLGHRFRLHARHLPGNPDIILPKYHTAIQVRGCFWHGHSCRDGHTPQSRRAYWRPKLEKTKRRDYRNDASLRRKGWRLLVVWECRIRTSSGVAREIARIQKSFA